MFAHGGLSGCDSTRIGENAKSVPASRNQVGKIRAGRPGLRLQGLSGHRRLTRPAWRCVGAHNDNASVVYFAELWTSVCTAQTNRSERAEYLCSAVS